jgi:hypothetical protein
MMPDETAPIPGQGMVGDLLIGLGKKVAKVAAHGMPLLFGRTVFHGLPYKFDKFLKEKIGTGEGVQAFGRGLYFAENPKVAGQYRMAGQAGYLNQRSAQIVNDAMEQAGGDAVKARNYLHQTAMSLPVNQRQPYFDAHNNFYKILEGGTGSIYRVDLPDSKIEKMLDWDKPLGEQSSHVKSVWSKLKGDSWVPAPNETMGDWFKRAKAQGDPESVLEELGIPGIKYLDQGSRPVDIVDKNIKAAYEQFKGDVEKAADYLVGYLHDTPANKAKARKHYVDTMNKAGKQTRNFVVFNPDDVKILERK